MKYSFLFGKTKNSPPKDEVTDNARFLVQAGFISKVMAGVYSYLPLGLRVINKIENIVREEMNKISGQEVYLPALHPKNLWKITGGWESIDILFKIKSRTGKDYALGQSHEEIITPLFKEYIKSYKDLPVSLYQIQQKFRDELRSKSGILRGREFNMKDMYSFHKDTADFQKYYDQVKKAYLKIFTRVNLLAKVTEASGGGFTQKISYEFMVLTEAGEDDILYCENCEYCVNLNIAKIKENDPCPKCNKGKVKKARASEVGNVFDLGSKYCKDFDIKLIDERGKEFYPVMGCYGIGISRLMGTIVEKFHDDRGIIWPETVSPYQAHLLCLSQREQILAYAEKIYQKLNKTGIEVLYDDREESQGRKLIDADLIGIPIRLVVSEKTKGKIEWKRRNQIKTEILSLEEVMKRIKK